MKDVTTGKKLKNRKTIATDWEALRRISDADIHVAIADDPDAQATDENFWKKATLVMPKPKPKQTVTMRLDDDLLQWFRQQSGYQTRINAILRAYMDAQNPPPRPEKWP